MLAAVDYVRKMARNNKWTTTTEIIANEQKYYFFILCNIDKTN